MKNSLLFLSIILLYSCGQKESTKDYSQIEISMDTVMVDSKGEILSLAGDLMVSDLSADKTLLYYLNPMTLQLEIVDLDELEFVQRVQYDEEGPNGVGRFAMQFQVLPDEKFFLGSYTSKGIFDLSSKLISKYDFRMSELNGDQDFEGYVEKTLVVNPKDENQLFTILISWNDQLTLLGSIDVQTKEFKNFPIPALDYMSSFKLVYSEGGKPLSMRADFIDLSRSEEMLIISSKVGSDIYTFDFATEDFIHYPAQPIALPAKKTVKIPQMVESMEEFQKHNRGLGQDINFSAPVWDDENEFYYRFAHFLKHKEEDGKFIHSDTEVHLMLLDKEFKVLSETLLENYKKVPVKHFAKDGMLWIFENMEDEMGFVRIKIR
ncbi:DUF4221 family protein [Belliella kenyensis]|uniref:DUF4221 family protein n=1 Tax=Belliella kenyensis TaxID=1472724 RepID=A0ABV8EMT0_9BACT|nr:DUF4221 family protein [Belliella kenyensis]MCH7401539.1 DUF4221 domain-containing protein [Belliella kenyensis]MDN3603181.1 DUF4221 family protein [Belliella kenyensis]